MLGTVENAAATRDGSPYFPGALAWALRAARQAIPADVFPDTEDMHDGPEGPYVTILHAPARGRVTVWVEVKTARTVHDEYPRRSGPARTRWTDAREAIAGNLQDHGFTDIVRTRAGLLATAPAAPEPGRVRVERDTTTPGTVGIYHLTAPGHPHLRSKIDGGFHHGPTSGSTRYTVHTQDASGTPQQLCGHATVEAAARSWGAWCGLPAPVTVEHA